MVKSVSASEDQFSDPENGVYLTDCHYVREHLTASYFLKDLNNKNENVIIETGHGHAVSHILERLKSQNVDPRDVSHIIVTHVHLDHCGGLSALLKICTNARAVCHPRGRLHLMNPEKLIQGSKAVYGEPLYKSLYGEIEGIAEDRIQTVEDNEKITVGGRNLLFLYTAGHARHHICVYNETDNSIFTGDTFGIAYPDFQVGSRRFIYPTTTPTDFDIGEARKSIARILDLKVRRVWLTHFGSWDDVIDGAAQLNKGLDEIERFQNLAISLSISGEDLKIFCYNKLKEFIQGELKERNVDLTAEQWKVYDYDVRLNSMGIAFAIDKNRKQITR